MRAAIIDPGEAASDLSVRVCGRRLWAPATQELRVELGLEILWNSVWAGEVLLTAGMRGSTRGGRIATEPLGARCGGVRDAG